MKIRLVFVGRTGQGEADRLTADYLRRIRRVCPVVLTEIKPATGRAMRGASRAERESRAALGAIGEREAVVVLDRSGRMMSSEEFARWLERLLATRAAVAFVVGGAEGLTEEVRRRADHLISLSKLTLPHGLARTVLAEQIYRALSIAGGSPYHR
jgi:23S rRNA (pseudouridine1915-N3)-methyltransferase